MEKGLYIFNGIPHWVDILDRKIYIGEEETIEVDFIPSSVLFANKDFLILAGDQGIVKLDGKKKYNFYREGNLRSQS